MPTTRRGEALRQQQGEDEVNVTLTEEEESVVERGHADEAASAGSRSTQQPTPQFPADFLSTLIETITRAQVEANRSLISSLAASNGEFRASTPVGVSPTTSTSSGSAAAATTSRADANFTRCTARFDGTSQDAEVLEAFLDAVEVYKECAAVSDEHALRGLPMLLEGEAAVWWRGVKASATTWTDAIARLRATYGVAQPSYQVLRQIFAAEQQEEERAEVFLCKVRALIAKLPYKLDEEVQVDFCYGLLHRRVIKRVPRDCVRSLDDLLCKVRIAEDTYKALKVTNSVMNNNKNMTPQTKTLAVTVTDRDRVESTPNSNSTAPRSNNKNRPRCSFCKLFGHVSEECRNRDKANTRNNSDTTPKELRCYGCGKHGVVRSKCDVCVKTLSKSDEKTSFNSLETVDVDFCCQDNSLDCNTSDTASCVQITNMSAREHHPMVNISVMGRNGVAIVDTGATHSVASSLLHRLLAESGVLFKETKRFVRLADGTQGWRDLLSAEVDIIIQGRRIMCQFLVLPGNNIRTLLGVDFLTRAGMVLDVARRNWSFSDDPGQSYDFIYTYTLDPTDANLLRVASTDLSLRSDEGSKLNPEQRRTLNDFIERRAPQFARDGPATEFATHRIKVSPHQDPDKTAAIGNMAAPQNVKHLKCFLQTSSWYRRFINNYAEVARPLTNLLKKSSVWRWDAEQQEAFERIKSLLVSAPILCQADESKPFVLCTDSSAYCLGAVLMQGEGHDERPIEYASRLLTSAERNYSTTEREALAVVWALGKFRGYVETAKVTVRTDHQPLRWLMSQRSPSGRLARWALTLQEFDLSIEYTPGRSNVVADTLSRPVCSEDQNECDLCMTVVDMPKRNSGDIRINQMLDPEVKKIIEDMESDEPSRGRPWSDRGYTLSDGILYRYSLESDDGEDCCLVVPEHERRQVMADLHDAPTAGHFGVERTLSRVRARYYWPGMRTFIANYIKECVPCQRYKADNRKPAGLLQTPAVSRRFEVVSVDLFGPLVETPRKNRWVLIVEDVCSRWVELFPLENATSVECAQTLANEVFLRYGVPRRLISDNGVQFVSEVMQQVCHVLGITQSLTPFYHPEANPIERKNRDLKPQLAMLVGHDHDTWDVHLAAVRFAMNSAITSSTGHSPAYLTFGRELRAPSDSAIDMRAIVECDNFVPSITPYLKKMAATLDEARDTHEKAQAVQKANADQKRRPSPEFKVGDLVLLKTQGPNDAGRGQTAKFIPRRDGPYKIGKVISPTTYGLENVQTGRNVGKYHVSHLTPFAGQVEPPIREKRRRGRPRRYLD